jgi:hypothetical protein
MFLAGNSCDYFSTLLNLQMKLLVFEKVVDVVCGENCVC